MDMKHLVIWRELVFKISNLSNFYTQQICNETFRLEVASLPPIWKISTNPPKSVGQVVPKLVILVHITGRTLLTPSQITCARKSPGKSTKKAKEGAQKEKYTRWRPQQAWKSGHRCVLKKVLKTSNLSKGSHIEMISGGKVVFVFVLQTGRQAIYLAFLFWIYLVIIGFLFVFLCPMFLLELAGLN